MGDKRSAISAVIVAMATLCWAAQCAACSPDHRHRYIQPTNFDLVRDADAIVVATATDQHASRNNNNDNAVHFRVDGALKGPAPRDFDTELSSFADRTFWRTVPPSNPNDLATANPQAYEGGCIRRLFTEGHDYIVFLSRGHDGVWRELDWPFTRVNEDYFGERSLWTRTIRDYLAIQALPEGWPQHRALERLFRVRQAEATPDGKAEAEDVRAALRALSARGWRRWRRPY